MEYYWLFGTFMAGIYNGRRIEQRQRPVFLASMAVVIGWPAYFAWLVIERIIDPIY